MYNVSFTITFHTVYIYTHMYMYQDTFIFGSTLSANLFNYK